MEKILNEEAHVEKVLDKSYQSSNPLVDVRLLVKHYVVEGKKRNEVIEHVIRYLKGRIKKSKFDLEKWEKIITSTFNRIIKEKKKKLEIGERYTLFNFNGISITQNEIRKINAINSDSTDVKKLAFVILVNSKINKLKYSSNSYGVNCSKKLFLEAELKFTHKNKKLINDLKELKYIEPAKYHLSDYVQVCFADQDKYEDDLVIDDFRDYILKYCSLLGERIGECTCGRPFRVNGNNHQMCNECAKKKEIIRWRENKKLNSTF